MRLKSWYDSYAGMLLLYKHNNVIYFFRNDNDIPIYFFKEIYVIILSFKPHILFNDINVISEFLIDGKLCYRRSMPEPSYFEIVT